jgi:hypothetical protein
MQQVVVDEEQDPHINPGTIRLLERAAWHYAHAMVQLARSHAHVARQREWYAKEAQLQRSRAKLIRAMRQIRER